MPTDERIAEVAGSFELPVGTQRIYENEVDDYNYLIIRKGRYTRNNCNSFTRIIEIVYVYEGEQKIADKEIVSAFEEIGLNFKYMDPDDTRIANTNKWVDMNTYVFERPERG